MATTSGLTREGGGGEDDRVMATAQKIVNSLNTSKNAREDMLLILSSFDNRLSNLSYVIKTGSESQSSVLDTAEKIILRSDSGMSSNAEAFSWYDSAGEAGDYLDAVDKILDLLDNLSVGPDPEVLDRAETVLQVAMSRLEEEFGHILIRNTVPLDAERLYGSMRRVSLSFAANEGEIDEEFASFEEVESGSVCFHERGGSLGDDLCVDLINSEAVMYLKDIADRMIRAGYEKECVQVYSSLRRDALDDCLVILGVEKLSIEEVQRIDWKSLDEKMKRWVRAVKAGDRVLLRGERRLCDVIFSGSDSAREDSELIKILGDQWVRNHRGQIRRYATAYLRAAWSKALSCLKDEGIGGSSNNASSKVALKERFKSFNACFEEIYRIQTGWKVPDPQLREELRISISENVLPAYRSFTGRFGSQIDSGRNAGKYIKYSPDDLENYLIDLFEGTPLVLHHLRRKNSS
ncbi:hypothetical protein OIU84_001477 [Salix udensis]|uniref:Exocyst subunit Exo70 family protein n=1 Tax=Salix udensis TaxID=889485 RepID=A0AAD6K8I1_9ROSI|nr:hypothetical protein OIU84_001477 [Salix udensis]